MMYHYLIAGRIKYIKQIEMYKIRIAKVSESIGEFNMHLQTSHCQLIKKGNLLIDEKYYDSIKLKDWDEISMES